MPIIPEDLFDFASTDGGARDLQSIDAEERERTAAAEAEAPGYMDNLKAWFDEDNLVVNAIREIGDEDASEEATDDPNYNPFSEEDQKIVGYEDHARSFIGATNDRSVELIKQDIDRERENTRIISESPGWHNVVNGIAANVLDPSALVPVLKGITAATKAGRLGQGLTQGAMYGFATEATREAALQGTQETRATEESAFNMLAGTVFGGVLGVGVAALSSTSKAATQQVIKKAMMGEDYVINVAEDGTQSIARSVGAAAVDSVEAEGLARINESLARGVSSLGVEALMPPSLRGVTSKFGIVRSFTNKFLDHNLVLNKEVDGMARGNIAEDLINQDRSQIAKAHNEVADLYKQHTGQGALGSTFNRKEGKVSLKEFNERIARSMRDEAYVDDIPQVAKAAAAYRAGIDKLTDRMVELKILDDALTPAQRRNYLTRMYDKGKMNQIGVTEGLTKKFTKYFMRYDKDGKLRDVQIDEDIASEAAQDAIRNIKGEGDAAFETAHLMEDVIGKGKFTKSRAILMKDSEMEEVLVNDASNLYTAFTTKASAMIRTKEALNELGYETLGEAKSALREEKDVMLKGVTNQKKKDGIDKAFEKDMTLMEETFRAVSGSLRKPGKGDRMMGMLQDYQYVRLLGGVGLTSIPEAVMTPFRHGFINTFKDGIMPVLRDFKSFKQSTDQLADMDVAVQHEMSSVLRAHSDPNSYNTGQRTEYDRYMSMVSDAYGKATGLEYITQGGRRLGAHVAMAETIRLLRKSKTDKGLSKKNIRELATAGISKHEYERVLAQVEKHSQEVHGSILSNHHLWEDKEAQQIFKNAIQKQTNSIVLKPGVGDIPFWAQRSMVGKLAFQFKSFSSAASGKISVSSLQRRDQRALQGIVALISLGAVSKVIKDKIAGREISDDPVEHMMNGLESSGVLGLMNGTLLGLGRDLASETNRRYFADQLAGTLLGPSGSMIKELGQNISGAVDGEMSEADMRRFKRLIPAYNVWYFKMLVEQMTQDDNDN